MSNVVHELENVVNNNDGGDIGYSELIDLCDAALVEISDLQATIRDQKRQIDSLKHDRAVERALHQVRSGA